MSRAPGLIKRTWQWTSKDGVAHSAWTYATRVRARGTNKLWIHRTRNRSEALAKHRRVLEGLEELTVDVVAPPASPKRFVWLKSRTIAEVVAEVAVAFGRSGEFGLQRIGGELLDPSRELRDERLISGDRLELVSRLTVDAAHARWCAHDLRVRRNDRGRREVEARYHRHVSPIIGLKRLDALTGEDIRALRVELDGRVLLRRNAPLRPETVRHVLSELRCFLSWAADDRGGRFIPVAPWPRGILPKVRKHPPERLLDDEVEALLATSEPYAFVIRLGLGTGLRWGDLCRLKASDLRREGGGAWCLEVAVGKTGEVLRVPVTDASLLRELHGRVGRLVPFSEKSGTAFNRTVRRHSGVERFHVHQLRHTFACRYLERGGSLAALQQILGHASVTTTERYARLQHGHVMQDAQRVGGTLERHTNGDKREAAH